MSGKEAPNFGGTCVLDCMSYLRRP